MTLACKILIALVALLSILFIYDYEVTESYFNNYKEASRNGVIPEDGRIPRFLPETAIDIHERHNVDTNETWVRFSFQPKDVNFWATKCSSIAIESVSLPRSDRSAEISWWNLNLGDNKNTIFKYFKCDSSSFLAIDELYLEAYYWQLAK
jgi:hypothetical protein